MKKIFSFFILIFVFFAIPLNVDAALGKTYHNYIMNIEELKFTGTEMSLSGYSFISGMDNYGILDNSSGGNSKTFIAMYVGWSLPADANARWEEILANYLKYDKDGKNVLCKDNNNCYIKEADRVVRDFWWSRCKGDGCKLQDEVETYRKNTTFDEINDRKCTYSKNGVEYDSVCIYKNVGFEVELDLLDGFKSMFNREINNIDSINYLNNFMSDKSIGFMLITLVGDEFIAREMDVPYDVCKYFDSNQGEYVKCDRGTKFSSNGITYNIPSPNSGVSLETHGMEVFKPISGGVSLIADTDYHFFNKDYAIVNGEGVRGSTMYNSSNTDGFWGEDELTVTRAAGTSSGQFKDSFYRLYVNKQSSSCKNQATRVGEDLFYFSSDDVGLCATAKSQPDESGLYNDDYYFYAPSSWLWVAGSFNVSNFKIDAIKLGCDNVFDSSNNIGNVDCSVDDENSITLNQCDGDSLETYIYIKTPYSSNEELVACGGAQTLPTNSSGNITYIPIKVKLNYLLNERGYLKFYPFYNEPVFAGKGFKLTSYNGYASSLYYNSLIEWSYADWYKNTSGKLMPFYYLSTDFLNPNDYCKKVGIDELLKQNDGKYYVLGDDGKVDSNNFYGMNDAIFNAADKKIQQDLNIYNQYGDKSNLSWNNIINDNFNDSVSLSTCNSNDKSLGCKDYAIKGGFSLESDKFNTGLRYLDVDALESLDSGERILFVGSGEANYKTSFVKSGKAYWLPFSFQFPNAYISLAENNKYDHGGGPQSYGYGDVLYTYQNIDGSNLDNFIFVGNKYFIGYKYSSDKFKFELADGDGNNNIVNPSLAGFNWELNGTCSVDVENGLFDNYGKPLYKYRSISLSTPFPKVDAITGVGYPINWSEWMTGSNKDDNIARLNNIRDVGVAHRYSITIGKLDGIDNTTSVMDINEYSNDEFYGDMTNFQDTKYSRFVRDYFNDMASDKTYCGLGFFSSSCDMLW